jgi:hydrogenase maturation factor HypF (carbamoyltransferase family)
MRKHEPEPENEEVCTRCGPYFVLEDSEGSPQVCMSEALMQAGFGILRGEIICVKAFGQSHIIVDARHHGAISRFRLKARMPSGTLPLMYASIAQVNVDFFVTDTVEAMLLAPDAGPVELDRKHSARETPIAAAAAGQNPARFPILLPRTRLHNLLLAQLKSPVVAVEESAIPRRTEHGGVRSLADFTLVLNCPAWPPAGAPGATGVLCVQNKTPARREKLPQKRVRR